MRDLIVANYAKMVTLAEKVLAKYGVRHIEAGEVVQDFVVTILSESVSLESWKAAKDPEGYLMQSLVNHLRNMLNAESRSRDEQGAAAYIWKQERKHPPDVWYEESGLIEKVLQPRHREKMDWELAKEAMWILPKWVLECMYAHECLGMDLETLAAVYADQVGSANHLMKKLFDERGKVRRVYRELVGQESAKAA